MTAACANARVRDVWAHRRRASYLDGVETGWTRLLYQGAEVRVRPDGSRPAGLGAIGIERESRTCVGRCAACNELWAGQRQRRCVGRVS